MIRILRQRYNCRIGFRNLHKRYKNPITSRLKNSETIIVLIVLKKFFALFAILLATALNFSAGICSNDSEFSELDDIIKCPGYSLT
jgi:hypothetical protein